MLTNKKVLNHDCYLFTYSYELKKDEKITVKPVWTVKCGAMINGEFISHSYTPMSPVERLGEVDLLVKIYRKNVHPLFPEGGRVT
jgi:hypothetical protein